MNYGVNPSIDNHDSDFKLFEPVSWLIKIDFINQFILNNNVLISVLGEPGSGKSTFAHLLQDKIDSSIQSVMITISSLMEMEPMLNMLCSKLNIQEAKSFADVVKKINTRQTRVLFLIDNAEQLSESILVELLEALKTQEANGYFHICLLSNFSLVKMTSRLARDTYKDMIHSIELQPLNENETKTYVMSRMALNATNTLSLSDEWLRQFYQLTEGNIDRINQEMLVFFANTAESHEPISRRILTYAYIPLCSIVAVSVIYFLFSQSTPDAPQVENLANTTMASVQLDLPLTSEIPNYQIAAIHQPMEIVSLQKAEYVLNNQQEIVSEVVSDDDDDESMVLLDKVIPVPQLKSLPKQDSLDNKNTQLAPTPKVVRPAQEAVAKVVQSPIQLKKAALHSTSKSKADDGHYTLQLIASRDKRELNRLAKRYSASGLKVRVFVNKDITWYVLTQGDYMDKKMAKNALHSLPKEISHFKAWVRSTQNLKDLG